MANKNKKAWANSEVLASAEIVARELAGHYPQGMPPRLYEHTQRLIVWVDNARFDERTPEIIG